LFCRRVQAGELRGTAPAGPQAPAPLTSGSGLALVSVQSTSSEWTDDAMALDWTRTMSVLRLRPLRDFCVDGMTVNVVEQRVCFSS